MIIRLFFKILANLFRVLVASFFIICVIIFWELSKGPISVPVINTLIEESLKKKITSEIQVNNVLVSWEGWKKPIAFFVEGIKFKDQKNDISGDIPVLNIYIDKNILFRGEIAPTSIRALGARVLIKNNHETKPNTSEFYRLFLNLSNEGKLKYLKDIELENLKVEIENNYFTKSALKTESNIKLQRDAEGISGKILLSQINGEASSTLELDADYNTLSKEISLEADFDQMRVGPLASLIEELGPLEFFDLPFSGSISLSIPLENKFASIKFNLVGGKGVITLPTLISDPTEVSSVRLLGSFTQDTKVTNVKSLEINFPEKTEVRLTKSSNHKFPIKNLHMSASYDGEQGLLEIGNLGVNLQGPRISLSGIVSGFHDRVNLNGELNLGVAAFNVNELNKYWPEEVSRPVRLWVLSNISEGVINNLRLKTRFSFEEDTGIDFAILTGSAKIVGANFQYVSSMPKVHDVDANLNFSSENFTASLISGKSKGLEIQGSKISVRQLSSKNQIVEADLKIKSNLSKQLEYLSKSDIQVNLESYFDTKELSGHAETNILLSLPLNNHGGLGQIKFAATSKLDKIVISNFLDKYLVTAKVANLVLDNKGLKLVGDFEIDTIPISLNWAENFSDSAPFVSQYNLSMQVDDVSQIRGHNLFSGFDFSNYLEGGLELNIQARENRKEVQQVIIAANLKNSKISLPQVGWMKGIGTQASAKISFSRERGDIGISEFKVQAADLEATGTIHLVDKGRSLKKIEFKHLEFGRSKLAGSVSLSNGNEWIIEVKGEDFDLSKFWENFLAPSSNEEDADFELPNLSLSLNLDRVWLGNKDFLLNVSGLLVNKENIWHQVRLRTNIDQNTNLKLDIEPKNNKKRSLIIKSNNAGGVFRFFDLYDNMLGGELSITGIYDDSVEGEPLSGDVNVKGFRVENAPILTHLLSILALTGILEALEGEGLAFQTLEFPFDLHKGILSLREARASGPSLGFTASGQIFKHTDTINLEGTIVPAYALNSVFGHIPLVGSLFTGGEKGGGVFAANYKLSGDMEDPKVLVNPLSALTPGFLRKVFGVFEGFEKDQIRQIQ